MQLKKILTAPVFALAVLGGSLAQAAEYQIDIKGAHAFVNFRVSHLGYSWLEGRFNTFDGNFSYDAKKPQASTVMVNIETASVDSNHAERDKHLRSKDFLDVKRFPNAKFVSTSFAPVGEGYALKGNLTLHGVTKPVTLAVDKIGEGKDPWGGYRAGFSGSTEFKMSDFGINANLGPASETVYMELLVEGIRK